MSMIRKHLDSHFFRLWTILAYMHLIIHVYLNNEILSLVIHAGYEGGNIAEKLHNQRVYT